MSSFEFLGYQSAETTVSALNNPGTIASRTKTYFTTEPYAGGNGQYIRQPDVCFNLDPRRGKVFKNEILKPDGSRILAKNESQYSVEPGYVDGEPYNGGLNCRLRPSVEKLPAVVLAKQTDNFQLAEGEIHTRVEYGPYDNYGNLLQTTDFGDVNKNNDEITTQFGYYPNAQTWILNRPAYTNVYEGAAVAGEPKLTTINYYDGTEDSAPDANGVPGGFRTPPVKGNLTMVKTGKKNEIWVDNKSGYDEYGNVVSQTDPKGNTSTTVYDPTYHLYPLMVKNPLGWETRMEYDYILGAPTKITDPNGVQTLAEYDSLGRRIKVAKQPDNLSSPTFIFSYQDSIPAITKTQAKIDNTNYTIAWQIINGLGQNLQSRSRAEIEGEVKDILTTSQYDSLGRKIIESQPYRLPPAAEAMPAFTLTGWNDAPKNRTAFDDLGRTVNVQDALGRTTTSSYNGLTTTITDPAGHQATTISDIRNNTLSVKDPANNLTTFEYDILNRLIKTTAPNSVVTTINYDTLGRKTEMTDPDLGKWTYQYDTNNNLISQTDAKNQTLRLEYDNLNRITKKIYPDNKEIVFEYDQGGFAKGQRTKMRDLTGFSEYKYDQRGQVIEEKKKIENEEAITRYSYNNAGALVSTTYPDGEAVTNTYNPLGQLKSIAGLNPYLTNIQYSILGATTKAEFGNQTQTGFQYDLTGRLKQIWTKNQTGDLIKWAYTQDQIGNITRIDDLLEPSKTLNYTYDSLDRLKTASGPYSASYNYDVAGNMLSKNEGEETIAMQYNDPAHVHAPKVVNGFTYRYDANGNLIEDEKRLIEWDYDNKPKKITLKDTGLVTEFEYDGNGQRVIKRVLGGQAPTATPKPTATIGLPTPTPTCTLTDQGDWNCDGLINELDLTILLSRWETEGSSLKIQTIRDNWKTN